MKFPKHVVALREAYDARRGAENGLVGTYQTMDRMVDAYMAEIDRLNAVILKLKEDLKK